MKLYEETMEINEYWNFQEEIHAEMERVLKPVLVARNIPEWAHEGIILGAGVEITNHVDVYCKADEEGK